jgi:peptide/nickel transport system permease protein
VKNPQTFRHAYHLDDPLPVQYARWWRDVLHGDLGRSVVHRTTVTAELLSRLPSTLEPVVLGTLFTVVRGIPPGVLSAVKRNPGWDYAIRDFSIGGRSVPGFWLGTPLLILAAIWWSYRAPIGKVSLFDNPLRNLQQYYLFALVLAIGGAAGIMCLERSTVLEVPHND